MSKVAVLASIGLVASCSFAAAQSEPNFIQGTPGSVFPYAAANEVQIINGVPCRTALVPGTSTRVPIECAGPAATGVFEPGTTGSIRVDEMGGAPDSEMPGSPFPYAAPNEVMIINGVPCRTVLVPGTNTRVPVECLR